jgi:hypothetical protein
MDYSLTIFFIYIFEDPKMLLMIQGQIEIGIFSTYLLRTLLKNNKKWLDMYVWYSAKKNIIFEIKPGDE